MTDEELLRNIASAFNIAREEGVIRRFADGVANAEEVMEWIKEAGYKSPKEIEKLPGYAWGWWGCNCQG